MRVLTCTRMRKKKRVLKETTHNRLYKWARRTRALEDKYGRWCWVCCMRCMGPWNKPKCNDGKKPRYKNIDRTSIRDFNNACCGVTG